MSYNPTVGRFTSRDPIAFKGGDVDLYRYVKNGPTDATDPSGLAADDPKDGRVEYRPSDAAIRARYVRYAEDAAKYQAQRLKLAREVGKYNEKHSVEYKVTFEGSMVPGFELGTLQGMASFPLGVEAMSEKELKEFEDKTRYRYDELMRQYHALPLWPLPADVTLDHGGFLA